MIKAMANFEICEALNLPINSICGRTSELERKGLLEIIGSKKNPFSQLPNSVYAVKQLDLF
jgi:sugar-specific transcriptional regulator TrmB